MVMIYSSIDNGMNIDFREKNLTLLVWNLRNVSWMEWDWFAGHTVENWFGNYDKRKAQFSPIWRWWACGLLTLHTYAFLRPDENRKKKIIYEKKLFKLLTLVCMFVYKRGWDRIDVAWAVLRRLGSADWVWECDNIVFRSPFCFENKTVR